MSEQPAEVSPKTEGGASVYKPFFQIANFAVLILLAWGVFSGLSFWAAFIILIPAVVEVFFPFKTKFHDAAKKSGKPNHFSSDVVFRRSIIILSILEAIAYFCIFYFQESLPSQLLVWASVAPLLVLGVLTMGCVFVCIREISLLYFQKDELPGVRKPSFLKKFLGAVAAFFFNNHEKRLGKEKWIQGIAAAFIVIVGLTAAVFFTGFCVALSQGSPFTLGIITFSPDLVPAVVTSSMMFLLFVSSTASSFLLFSSYRNAKESKEEQKGPGERQEADEKSISDAVEEELGKRLGKKPQKELSPQQNLTTHAPLLEQRAKLSAIKPFLQIANFTLLIALALGAFSGAGWWELIIPFVPVLIEVLVPLKMGQRDKNELERISFKSSTFRGALIFASFCAALAYCGMMFFQSTFSPDVMMWMQVIPLMVYGLVTTIVAGIFMYKGWAYARSVRARCELGEMAFKTKVLGLTAMLSNACALCFFHFDRREQGEKWMARVAEGWMVLTGLVAVVFLTGLCMALAQGSPFTLFGIITFSPNVVLFAVICPIVLPFIISPVANLFFMCCRPKVEGGGERIAGDGGAKRDGRDDGNSASKKRPDNGEYDTEYSLGPSSSANQRGQDFGTSPPFSPSAQLDAFLVTSSWEEDPPFGAPAQSSPPPASSRSHMTEQTSAQGGGGRGVISDSVEHTFLSPPPKLKQKPIRIPRQPVGQHAVRGNVAPIARGVRKPVKHQFPAEENNVGPPDSDDLYLFKDEVPSGFDGSRTKEPGGVVEGEDEGQPNLQPDLKTDETSTNEGNSNPSL